MSQLFRGISLLLLTHASSADHLSHVETDSVATSLDELLSVWSSKFVWLTAVFGNAPLPSTAPLL